jgi:hypothetical protein
MSQSNGAYMTNVRLDMFSDVRLVWSHPVRSGAFELFNINEYQSLSLSIYEPQEQEYVTGYVTNALSK